MRKSETNDLQAFEKLGLCCFPISLPKAWDTCVFLRLARNPVPRAHVGHIGKILTAGLQANHSQHHCRQVTVMAVKWNEISHAGSLLAKGVSGEGEFALASGSLCETGSLFRKGLASKEEIQQRFRDQVQIFVDTGMDLIIAEYISHVQEAEWMVEVIKESGMPTAVSLAISREGDHHGVLPGECALRLVRAGADIIGVNCRFDPERSLDTIALMQEAIQREGLKTHWMVQPVGYWVPDAGPSGFTSIPENPLALEPRLMTRIEAHKFARKAYNMGVRYIGGCCGFEPYHIRAVAEELAKERGRFPPGSDKSCLWGKALVHHAEPQIARRANREYWENLEPATGRPFSAAYATTEDTWKTSQDD